MFRLTDYTRKVAVGAALAAFMLNQAGVLGSITKAAFVDQPLPAFSETLSDEVLNIAEAPDLVPRVSIEDSRISVGETIEVQITLSSAPDGLAGFRLLVDLGDFKTARIVSVAFPDFGMVFREPGNGDAVRLAAVTLEEVSVGSIGPQLTIMQIDDDERNPLPISVSSGTVSMY